MTDHTIDEPCDDQYAIQKIAPAIGSAAQRVQCIRIPTRYADKNVGKVFAGIGKMVREPLIVIGKKSWLKSVSEVGIFPSYHSAHIGLPAVIIIRY
jgi:hypothetical protein